MRSRTPRRRSLPRRLVLFAPAVSLALFASPPVSAAVVLRAPATAKLASRISVSATGLKPGHYSLVIARVAAYTTCLATIATGNASHGRLSLSGVIPTRLACHLGRNPTFGDIAVTIGTYQLSVGELVPPASYSSAASYATTRIKLVA